MEYVTPPEDGIYEDVDMETYLSWNAASSSRLRELNKSAKHLKYSLEHEEEETDALRLGTLIHTALLEPERYDEEFTVLQSCQATKGDGDPCTNPAKYIENGEQKCGIHGDENDPDAPTPIKETDAEVIRGILQSVKESDSARSLLYSEGESELTLVWTDPDIGIKCKARLDRISRGIDGGAFLDLKSCRSAERHRFQKDIWSHRYDLQSAFYSRGLEVLGKKAEYFVWLAVSKQPPYLVKPYFCVDAVMREAHDQVYDLLDMYRGCIENDTWPGLKDEVDPISVPDWSMGAYEEQREEIRETMKEYKL